MNVQIEIKKIMREKLLEAQSKNPSYSLRSFAYQIGLYSSTISEILNGDRKITRKMAERILKGMMAPLRTKSIKSCLPSI